jgi:hypothetical protein
MTTPPYPLHPEPMKKNWIERNPKWKIPLGCLTLLILVGGFVTGLLTVIVTSFHHSDAYQQAIALASENTQVREQLGQPMKPGWFTSGNISINGSTGDANLVIPISGPRGKGTIRAAAKKSGTWKFTSLTVTIEGQPEPIDLLSVQAPSERDF